MSVFSLRGAVIGLIAASFMNSSYPRAIAAPAGDLSEKASEIAAEFSQEKLTACIKKFDDSGPPVTGFYGMYTHRHAEAAGVDCMRVYNSYAVDNSRWEDDPSLNHTECVFTAGMKWTVDGKFPEGNWETRGARIIVDQPTDPSALLGKGSTELVYPNGEIRGTAEGAKPSFELNADSYPLRLSYSFDENAILTRVPSGISSSSGSADANEESDRRKAMGAALRSVVEDPRIPTPPQFDMLSKTLNYASHACAGAKVS